MTGRLREANKEIGDEIDESTREIEELSDNIEQQHQKLGVVNRAIDELKRKPSLKSPLLFTCHGPF